MLDFRVKTKIDCILRWYFVLFLDGYSLLFEILICGYVLGIYNSAIPQRNNVFWSTMVIYVWYVCMVCKAGVIKGTHEV
jgi:hypothetical protein